MAKPVNFVDYRAKQAKNQRQYGGGGAVVR
jgi:hypothetical protein